MAEERRWVIGIGETESFPWAQGQKKSEGSGCRVSVAEEIGFRLAEQPGERGSERKFQYHQRPRGSRANCARLHTDTVLYRRSCVRPVTGNGFTSVKGDIKKMKNTPALLALATCAGI